MVLSYTGAEALQLVNSIYQDHAIAKLHEASFSILRLAIINNIDEGEALQQLLAQPTIQRDQAIVLTAALHRLCQDKTGALATLYKVKIYEYQQKQLGQQLFALESNDSIAEKKELRQIFIEQQAVLKSKINQLLNSFTVVEPSIINFRLNRR